MSPELDRKEALKLLKKQRADKIKAAAAVSKQQKKDMGRIKERLGQGPATAPEIATDLDMPARDAMWYLSAMRKYGVVSEAKKQGDYFSYQLVTQENAAC